MPRLLMTQLTLITALMSSIAAAQPPANPAGGPYKVAFWYEADRPTTSIQYQVYDLSKGEYQEAAVDRWLRTILAKYPGHGAYVRDIRTQGLPGATEADRLALALDREKLRWAELQRQPTKPVPRLIETSTTLRLSPVSESPSRTSLDRPAPGSPGTPSRPAASPFPYPYRSGPR